MAYEDHSLKAKFIDFGGSWNTKEEPQKIAGNETPDVLNTQPVGRGAFGSRFGISQVGDNNAGVGAIKSLYNFARGSTETLIKSYDDTLEYLDSGTWTAISGIPTYTAGLEFGFANDLTYVYGCNGTDNFFRWSGSGSITEYAGNPKGNILIFFLRRLFVMGITATPTTVYYSVINDPVDFGGSGSGNFTLGEGGDPITGASVFKLPSGETALFIFKKSSRVFMINFDSSGNLSIQEVKRDTGAINHRSVVLVENDIMYIDEAGNIQSMGFSENIANDIRVDPAARVLSRTTPDYTVTSACGIYSKKRKMLVYSMREYASSANNVQLVYFSDPDLKCWRRWKGLNANQFALYGGDIVWGSSTDYNVYKYDESKFDDLDGNIHSYQATKDTEGLDQNGVPHVDRYKQIRFAIVRGFISTSATMNITTLYDGNEDDEQTTSFEGTDDGTTDPSVSVAFGTQLFARAVFGGGAALNPTAFPMREFLACVSLDGRSFLRARIIPEVDGAGTPYLITSITLWMSLEEEEKLTQAQKI